MVESILDTDILSEYLKGHDRIVLSHAGRYAKEHGVFTFTSVTVYENVYGFELKSAVSQLKRALAWLNRNDEVTPTSADFVTAAAIRATARRQGFRTRTTRLPDCRRGRSPEWRARYREY